MRLKANTELQNGKYRIIRVLGQGGFGITYLAEHTMLDKMVAIKEFFPKEYCDRDEASSHLTIGTKNSVEIVDMLKAKFIKEARNISKLNHPNIITIHDIFTENDTAYYVMEYVEGQSLSEMIKASGAMDEARAVGYIRRIADAIGYMHSLSMNHLDIKPANIMVRAKDDEPVLIDFGLSKQYDASGGQTSTTPIGISHGFAPIEQYRPGGVATFTPQTDVYALGATLFNLLTGTVPPHYSEILEDGLPELPSTVTQRTADAVEHAMEIKKNKRPKNISEFIAYLPCQASSTLDLESPVSKSLKSSVKGQHKNNEETEADNESHNLPPHLPYGMVINEMGENEDEDSENTVYLEPIAGEVVNYGESVDPVVQDPNKDDGYVDLGLSVKWRNGPIGCAEPHSTDNLYKIVLDNGQRLYSEQFIQMGYQLPSIRDYEELLEKCQWSVINIDGKNHYKIQGPNRNYILLPIPDYSAYLTHESFKPDRGGYSYYLFIGEYTHTLGKAAQPFAGVWLVRK